MCGFRAANTRFCAFVRSFVGDARATTTDDRWMNGWMNRSRGPSAHVHARVVACTRAAFARTPRRDRHRPPAYFQSLKSLDMARERRETSPSATGGAIDGDQLPGVPVRAREQSPRKSVREANRGAVQRYRDRQRARTGTPGSSSSSIAPPVALGDVSRRSRAMRRAETRARTMSIDARVRRDRARVDATTRARTCAEGPLDRPAHPSIHPSSVVIARARTNARTHERTHTSFFYATNTTNDRLRARIVHRARIHSFISCTS